MLSAKKRKILTRVMAALALGASFLGVASSISAKIVLPKKTQLTLRKRREMRAKKDLKTEINNLAAKEAEQVLTQQQVSEEFSKKRKKKVKQKINPLKFFGLAVWGVSLIIFAASLIVNTPFPLGNFVLMAMPGERHTAILFLEPAEAIYQVDNEFTLDLTVDTGGRDVSFISAGLQFEPQRIQVQQIDVSHSVFKETVKNSFDNTQGRIKIIRTSPKNGICNASDALVAKIKFKTLSYIGKTKIDFVRNKKEITNGVFLASGSNSNILKETKAGFYKITPKAPAIKKIEVKKISQPIEIDACLEDWQNIIGCDLFSKKTAQNKIESKNLIEGAVINSNDINATFDLIWNEENLYLAIAVIDNELTDEDDLEINLEKNTFKINLNGEILNGEIDETKRNYSLVKNKIFKMKEAYVAEFAFPWKMFTDKKLCSGNKFNFNITLNDQDKGKKRTKLIWSENGKGEIELK